MSDEPGTEIAPIRTLERYLHEQGTGEVIDGVLVSEAAQWADLSIAHTPVVAGRFPLWQDFDAWSPYQPLPALADLTPTNGGERWIVSQASYNWRNQWHITQFHVEEYQARTMRARYLLWRGYFYRLLCQSENEGNSRLNYHVKDQILAVWFPEGVYVLPPEIWKRSEAQKAEGKPPFPVVIDIPVDSNEATP